MNTKQIFGTLAFTALSVTALAVATGAQAETYGGVLSVRSDRQRSDLAAEARQAARNPVAGEASFTDEAPVSGGTLARADVRGAAVAHARAGNPYGDSLGAGVLSLRGGSANHRAAQPQARKAPAAGGSRAPGG